MADTPNNSMLGYDYFDAYCATLEAYDKGDISPAGMDAIIDALTEYLDAIDYPGFGCGGAWMLPLIR